jgi:hypothetical protein
MTCAITSTIVATRTITTATAQAAHDILHGPIKRLPFRAFLGRAGRDRAGGPQGHFDRSRIRQWLEAMDAELGAIRSWMP